MKVDIPDMPSGKRVQFANWKITIYNIGKSNVNGEFSIAMLVYPRYKILGFEFLLSCFSVKFFWDQDMFFGTLVLGSCGESQGPWSRDQGEIFRLHHGDHEHFLIHETIRMVILIIWEILGENLTCWESEDWNASFGIEHHQWPQNFAGWSWVALRVSNWWITADETKLYDDQLKDKSC